MSEPRCLLTIHAHPDDEASKGAPTVARYAREGVRCVLVCCTGGEEGDVANQRLVAEGGLFHGLAEDEIKRRLAEKRPLELAESASIIGFDEVVMLGYRDSGMPESEANRNPASFHMAPMDEAIGRLVAVIRSQRPDVILTYGDEQSGYPHPDHLKVHDISLPAFERAGNPAWYPEAGPVWQPKKIYYTVWTKARAVAWHQAFEDLGLESPYDENWFSRPWQDHRITTKIPIDHELWKIRTAALIAHETQIDPDEKFWFGLPEEVQWSVYRSEDWILADSTVGYPEPDTIEDDLFARVEA